MCLIRQEWTRGIRNTRNLLDVTILIEHIQKMAPSHTKAAALTTRAIQKIINDADDETKKWEEANMRDRDELRGSAANKKRNLFTPLNQQHKEIIGTLNQHLELNGLQSNIITNEIKALEEKKLRSTVMSYQPAAEATDTC